MSIKEVLTRILNAIKDLQTDYIVERGVDSNGWAYTKWASGWFEALGWFEDKTITNGYITFPLPIDLDTTQRYYQNICPLYGSSSNRGAKTLYFTASGPNLYLRTYSGAIPTGLYSWTNDIKGRWK